MKDRLGSLCSKIGSGATPRGGKDSYHSTGISFIRSQNILDYYFTKNGLVYIDEIQADQLSSVCVETNDVLINITGDSVARVCIVDSHILPARVNQHVCIIRPDLSKILPEYLMLYLMNQKELLLQMASTGGTRNALTKKMLENFEIEYPPLDIQRKIVGRIKPIINKVELINQAIHNYESIVESIYDKFFKIGDELPTNWKKTSVFNCVSELKYKNTDQENYQVLSVVKEGKFKASEDVFTKQVYSKSTKNYKIIRSNQIAYNPARANIGSIAMLKEFDIGLVSPVYTVFEVKEDITPTYFYYYMKQPIFLEMIKHHAIGTTRQNFPFEAFKMFPIVVPPMDLQLKFDELAKPIEQKIAKLKEENEVLAEIRDTLLPKLMSGELLVEVGVENG